MKTPVSFLAVFLFCVVSNAAPSIVAGPITNPANDHVYYLLEPDTWTNSEIAAVRLGGHLVTIDDADEDSWVYSTFSSYGGTNRTLRTGLNDARTEGSFIWPTGEILTYQNWAPGEPNNLGDEDFVCYFPPDHAYRGKWNDCAWYQMAQGVVEVDLTPRLHIEVSTVAVKWLSQTGTVYQLQYRSSFTGNTWTNLGLPEAGTGSYIGITDSVLNEPRRYYRLLLLQ